MPNSHKNSQSRVKNWPNTKKSCKNYQTLEEIGQSGEIFPSLVTLLATDVIHQAWLCFCFACEEQGRIEMDTDLTFEGSIPVDGNSFLTN